MAAAARNGSFTFRSPRSGLTSVVDFYDGDVLAAAITLNRQGAAVSTSPTFVTFGEDMVLVDASIATGITDTTGIVIMIDDVRTATALRMANYVNTLANRPAIGLYVKAGQRFGGIEF